MTAAEAVEVLHLGYGDDCPEGGDRYLEARLVLDDAGLLPYTEHESSQWPKRKPSSFERALMAAYLPAIREDLNRSLYGDIIEKRVV